MNGAPEQVRLPDGRRLAVARYGADDGLPVLYCHGFPGSRLEACLAAPSASELGITLIAADRPGFGGSDPAPERTLADGPRDLLGLADALGLGRFHLVGVSGGGPYALAAAAAIPERLAGVSIVCGLGELGGPEDTRGMAPMAARAVRLYQRLPGFADWLYSHLATPLFGAHPEWIFRVIAGSAPPADQAVLADTGVRECLLGSFREAFAQGGEGPAHELAIYTSPWGIDLGAVRVPVGLWHGEQDTTVPVGMGRRHADRIPGVRAHFLPDEGHFSLVVNHMTAILSELTAL